MHMSRRQLPLNALRAYEAAARHCHLKSAAEELGVTQGAISQQVKALEEKLGQTLFLRQNKSLQLTDSGKRLLHSITEGLDCITQGVIQLDAEAENMVGDLFICSTASIFNALLMPVIGRFAQRYPEVSLHSLEIGPLERVLPRNMDISVCFGLPELDHTVARKLYETEMFPVASASLLLNRKPITDGAALLDYPLLHDQANIWPNWFQLFEQTESKSRVSNIYYTDTYQAVMAARTGQGVALAEYYEVAQDLSSGRLIRMLEQSIPLEAGGYLITPPESQQTLRSRVFVEFIDQYLTELAMAFSPPG